MLTKKRPPETATVSVIREDPQLRAELAELKRECAVLRAQLEGNIPQATAWLQLKVWRQRSALDALTARATRQRFVLRTLAELGHELTREQYQQARGKLGEQAAGRVGEWDPA